MSMHTPQQYEVLNSRGAEAAAFLFNGTTLEEQLASKTIVEENK
jgi:hypothetical protein